MNVDCKKIVSLFLNKKAPSTSILNSPVSIFWLSGIPESQFWFWDATVLVLGCHSCDKKMCSFGSRKQKTQDFTKSDCSRFSQISSFCSKSVSSYKIQDFIAKLMNFCMMDPNICKIKNKLDILGPKSHIYLLMI